MKHDDMLGARGIARQNGDYEEDSGRPFSKCLPLGGEDNFFG